jgi:hypothetical protein
MINVESVLWLHHLVLIQHNSSPICNNKRSAESETLRHNLPDSALGVVVKLERLLAGKCYDAVPTYTYSQFFQRVRPM